jgi:hypothetical protein
MLYITVHNIILYLVCCAMSHYIHYNIYHIILQYVIVYSIRHYAMLYVSYCIMFLDITS